MDAMSFQLWVDSGAQASSSKTGSDCIMGLLEIGLVLVPLLLISRQEALARIEHMPALDELAVVMALTAEAMDVSFDTIVT
jgi:hypothetical protein